ncbi:DUF2490 domain-containing protein [Flagellimonas zhangzhouensis]|uniref:DUF2490 domain-containing protein n=1 Tax=Flagellimonas zhangzhouensis TaxID=1073328 RepID=A0A1H2VF40_9FLAO|nr:DUF2490 domain-containing protein [Allomuricauda zhangzhouensis]SDQ08604.1 Protein of unknown function [Allomuricauda zhangzhouensis]SDW66489.1 Protein of unknown function [Allomuricauda zhangzhouensis]
MTTYSTKWFIPLLMMLVGKLSSAQDNLTAYWQPEVAVNYPINGFYSHNFSIANRNYAFSDDSFRLKTRQIDVAHFSTWKTADNQSLALGFQYRFRNNFEDRENELRFTQQYNFTKSPNVIRFGHRLRSEQRITNSLTIFRFRYRFAMDFPLVGEKLDVGEPYFVSSVENLWSVARTTQPQFDVRLTSHLGWKLDENLKLQLGLEYRMEDYTAIVPENVLFLYTSAQLSL